jgi:hypothetical protein
VADIDLFVVHIPVTESYVSVLELEMKKGASPPPATSTFPVGSNVAV